MEAQLIEAPAQDIAQRQQGWGALEQLGDEDITFLSKTLAGLRVPAAPKLQKASSLITSAVIVAVNNAALHLPVALRALLEEGPQPTTKTSSFIEVDIPSELKKRLLLRGIGRLATSARETANSSSKELLEASNASPPPHHMAPETPRTSLGASASPRIKGRGRSRRPNTPRIDGNGKPSHQRAGQGRYGQRSPRLNAAHIVMYRLRIIIAGEPAGARDKFGGFGSQICLLLHRLEACEENNAGATARLSEEEGELLSRMARSRMDPSGVPSVIFEPNRDRRLRVVNEERRAYNLRTAHSGAPKNNRGYSTPDTQGSSRDGPREHAARITHYKRSTKGRDSESRKPAPKFPNNK